MSELISGRLHGLLSRNSTKHQPQTRADKILALERIKDPEVRARALALHFKRQKMVDDAALCLLIGVALAGICVVLGPFPVGAKVVFTALLVGMGKALTKYVLHS